MLLITKTSYKMFLHFILIVTYENIGETTTTYKALADNETAYSYSIKVFIKVFIAK